MSRGWTEAWFVIGLKLARGVITRSERFNLAVEKQKRRIKRRKQWESCSERWGGNSRAMTRTYITRSETLLTRGMEQGRGRESMFPVLT
jgi:hypothetical protein